MTTGGTVVRRRHAPIDAPPARRRLRLDDPRLVEHLPVVVACVVFAGCFLRIRQRWFIEGMAGFGYDTWVVQTTVDGTAIAPNQYRPLMPWVDHLASAASGVPLPTTILATDLALLVVTVVVLYRLCARLGAPSMTLAAAAAWAYWVAKLDHWHPEVMLLTAVVALSTLLLVSERPGAWALLGLGLICCGARTDYAAGLGLVVLAVGVRRGRVDLAASGVAVGATALASTLLLADVFYPQARYGVALVQLPFNLTPGVLAMAGTFYGVLLLAPALLVVRRRSLPPLSVVIAWFSVQFAATFVVGRVEESRVFMPFAPVLAVAAVVAWRELRAGTAPLPGNGDVSSSR